MARYKRKRPTYWVDYSSELNDTVRKTIISEERPCIEDRCFIVPEITEYEYLGTYYCDDCNVIHAKFEVFNGLDPSDYSCDKHKELGLMRVLYFDKEDN